MERAAELAVEKAREAAVGLVRIVGVGPVRSAAPVAAGNRHRPDGRLGARPEPMREHGLAVARRTAAGRRFRAGGRRGRRKAGPGRRRGPSVERVRRNPHRPGATGRSRHHRCLKVSGWVPKSSYRPTAGSWPRSRSPRWSRWRRFTSGSPPPGAGWPTPPAGSSPKSGRTTADERKRRASPSPRRPGSPSSTGHAGSASRCRNRKWSSVVSRQ